MARKSRPPESVAWLLRTLPLVRMPLASLQTDPENANLHDRRNIDAIKESLARFGQVEDLVIHSSTNVVIGGNGRLEAMRELGWTECDVKLFDGTPSECRALGIALNRTAELSRRDDVVLAAQLRALQSEDFPLGSVGYQDTEVDAILARLADEAVSLPRDEAGGRSDGGSPRDEPGRDEGPPRLYPLSIVLTRDRWEAWRVVKDEFGTTDDTKAFLEVLDERG